MVKNLKKKKGFTLIELIIVIAILGILALVAIPKFGDIQKSARQKADIANAKTIADTTAMLIANEKIKVGTSNVATAGGTAGYGNDIVLGAAGGSGKLIGDALQDIPTPQIGGGSFTVNIGEDTGNVTVEANGSEVYPNPSSDWTN